MKILYPVEVFYPSQAGGPANTVHSITKNIVAHGLEPIVVSTDKGLDATVPLNRWKESEGGRVIYVKTRHLNMPLRQIWTALRTFRKSDVVQLSSIFFPTAFLTAFAARLFSKKLVWSPRGELDPAALTHSAGRKKPVLWLIRNLVGTFPTFHSTCDEETMYIRSHFGESARVVQIPNFLEIPEAVNRNPDSYLLYIGRIHPKKAIDDLLRALSVSSVFMESNRKFKIAGRGKPQFENELRAMIEKLGLTERVELLGQVEGAEKQRLLANAYWTIMPSHTENFGIVVLESMAQSTPVIASTGTPWNILADENIGRWTENSPKILAATIDEVLSMSEADYLELRSRCRAFVEDRFDVKKNINQWVEFYQTLK